MNKIILLAFLLINTLSFSQYIDETELNQLSNKIAEETCDCVQNSNQEDGAWKDAVNSCFLDSFKKNESFLTLIVGYDYLEEEKAEYIFQIIVNSINYWVSTCSQQLSLDENWTPDIFLFVHENEMLNYDILKYKQEQISSIDLVFEEEKFDVTFLNFYEDEKRKFHIVVKTDKNETFDLFIFDELNSFLPKLQNNKILVDDKITITTRQYDYNSENPGVDKSPVLVVGLQKTIHFNKNFNQNEFEQLANKIAEETCLRVKKIKDNKGNWRKSIEQSFLETFKNNESNLKQILGDQYLDEVNAPNILHIVELVEDFGECLKKLNTEEMFVPLLLFFFNNNANLTYDLVNFFYDSNGGSNDEIVEEEAFEEEVFEVNGVFVKSYLDKLEIQYIVVKIENVDVHFMIFDAFDNYIPYFIEKKLKTNDKVSIKYSILNLFDDDKNDYVDEKRILNIEKIE